LTGSVDPLMAAGVSERWAPRSSGGSRSARSSAPDSGYIVPGLGPRGEAAHGRRLPQLSPSKLSLSPSAREGGWPSSSSICGTPGGLQPSPNARVPKNLRPEMLLARTHAGGFSARSSSASTLFAEPLRGGGDLRRAGGGASDAGSAAGSNGRFYATAPAGRIGIAEVQEATGVGLSDAQLSALRGRYKGAGGGAFGGENPSAAELRQAVFGSLVLRPGQWPRSIPEDRVEAGEARAAKTPGSSTHRSRLSCSTSMGAGRAAAAPAPPPYRPGPGRGDYQVAPSTSQRICQKAR